jgi:hypothetical protein
MSDKPAEPGHYTVFDCINWNHALTEQEILFAAPFLTKIGKLGERIAALEESHFTLERQVERHAQKGTEQIARINALKKQVANLTQAEPLVQDIMGRVELLEKWQQAHQYWHDTKTWLENVKDSPYAQTPSTDPLKPSVPNSTEPDKASAFGSTQDSDTQVSDLVARVASRLAETKDEWTPNIAEFRRIQAHAAIRAVADALDRKHWQDPYFIPRWLREQCDE